MPELPPDLMQLLSGGGPEVTGQIANVLRRRQQLGELGALSGDRVLGPLGGKLIDDTTANMESLAQNRDKAESRRVLENYYKAIDENNRRNAELRGEELDWRYFDTLASADSRREAAAASAANKQPRAIPNTVQERFSQLGTTASGINNLLNVTPYKEEWASTFPMERTLKNWAARNIPMVPGLVGDEDIAAQQWQSELKNVWELAYRNDLFGATLTDNEIREFQKASIGENFSKEQVDSALRKIKERVDANIRRAVGANVKSYDPEEIISALGLPEDYELGDVEAAVEKPSSDEEDPYQRALSSVEFSE